MNYENVQLVVSVLGLFAIFAAVATYLISKKQWHFELIKSCMERYHKLLDELYDKDGNLTQNKTTIIKYIDFCSEELFYINCGYFPEKIAVEWKEGIKWAFVELGKTSIDMKVVFVESKYPVLHAFIYQKKS